MSNVPTFTLNTGAKIPAIGIGSWMGSYGEADRAEAMVAKALKLGYRAIDTAAGYHNEAAVGRAIRASGIPRRELFVTTKLTGEYHDNVQAGLDASLKELDLEYVDLYLVHWPHAQPNGKLVQPNEYPTVVDTWKQMEKLLETGKCKAIGVSNFDIKKIQSLLDECTVVPAANQIELHPCLPQTKVVKFCKSKGILVTAYSSLGQPNSKLANGTIPDVFFSNDKFKAIAAKHNATVAQVLLSWAVARGINVQPKSETEERLRSNLNAAAIKLDSEDTEFVDNYHKGKGLHRSLLPYHSTGNFVGVFGYTYEQLGWPMVEGGFVQE
ncbi:putative GCY1-galactose-induced protein of aldo/keto reductase family [Exidia glandulosa HHB12029]|uniref:Putative GCY1-galactose-induced protein of aldo/keto reductase family n=1 Tax=Exidia glandulosa HHB12029 TaxID=1314781 RepID=A0A165QIK4_EXIGL|nr:putative GCY1-galactose-induced protein of aldo/keto reductase family [Exidia glandulosa HHB12029]